MNHNKCRFITLNDHTHFSLLGYDIVPHGRQVQTFWWDIYSFWVKTNEHQSHTGKVTWKMVSNHIVGPYEDGPEILRNFPLIVLEATQCLGVTTQKITIGTHATVKTWKRMIYYGIRFVKGLNWIHFSYLANSLKCLQLVTYFGLLEVTLGYLKTSYTVKVI